MQTHAHFAILNDPIAFAGEIYSALCGQVLDDAPPENPTAVTAFDAASALVRDTAAAGGDVGHALDLLSDVVYGMAGDAQSRGMDLGTAFACFRHALIGALTPNVGHAANHRSNLAAVERNQAKLRGEPVQAKAAD